VQVLDGEWSGDTALTAVKNAISAHRCDVVKLLVELGCDVNMTDSDGWYVQWRVRAGEGTTGAVLGQNIGGWPFPFPPSLSSSLPLPHLPPPSPYK